MPKTIIINEEMANELKDMLTMTQFKFKANIKKFLASLLEDPTGAEPDMIFTKNGLDKNKLIKALVDNKVITKKMTIDDHDADGNPHTARMIVKYTVPKERFNERLDALYDMLFPDAEGKIHEDITRDELQIMKNSPLTIGVINQTNPNRLNGMIADMAAEEYNKKVKNKKELDEEGGAGGGAASCSGVDGNGLGSGEYVQPLFGGISVRKKKKDKKNVGGNPYMSDVSELNEVVINEMVWEDKATADDVYNKYYTNIDRNLFNAAINADPTAKPGYMGKYTKWILGLAKKGLWKPSDTPETRSSLERFAKIGNKLPKKDIQQYQSVAELYNTINQTQGTLKTRSEVKSGAKKVYEDEYWTVIIPETMEAAQLYGANTKWCTAAEHNNMFKYYNEEGPLYIIISKSTGTKFQFHFQSGQYMDAEDEPISDFSVLSQFGRTDGLERFIRSVMIKKLDLKLFPGDARLVQTMLDNGTDPRKLFTDIDNFREGLAVVELNGKYNWLRQDNGRLLSDQWFDRCSGFREGLARVKLTGKENWIRADNGQYFSDQWFDYCHGFEEGLAVVELNGKRNWIRADNGQYFSDQWFDGCGNFNEGLAVVKLNGKWNWIRADNGQYFSDQWFDYCGDFEEGLAVVKLNGKYNWLRQDNGQYFSDQWFEYCWGFREGLARVRLNDNLYYLRKDGVLCDYETKEPIQQQSELNEMVNRILKKILNESQESKSIDAAKRLFMQRTGKSAEEADKFVRVNLRNDMPVLRDKNGGKFILGVTRMFLDGQLRDARTVQNLNKTLKLLTQGHFNEYDRNLNGMSAQDVISRFATAMKQMDDQEREELGNMQFNENNNYQIVRIDDFEQSSQYGKYTSWCVTHYENMFNSYTSNGIGQFYFCLRNGFENEQPTPGENCPLDSYGLSMVAVSVDENGRLNTCTCRWNHDNGGNDNIMGVKEISELIGQNFFDVFKPNGKWTEIVENVKSRLAAGESPDDVFDYCGDFGEGLAVVKLNGKYNWLRQDNGQLLSDQWFDGCGNFNEGLAIVELNGKWNWIRQDNGQPFSDQWFDRCSGFREGLARVKLTGKYNWIRQDNGQYFSDQWFDGCGNFNEGLAVVELNGKWNWIRIDNGQYFSDQWFDDCGEFDGGLAWVELNGKLYYMRKDGVLCDYETKEPIQQPGLNETVYRILKRIISEAVTGEDGRKSSAVYAYAKNSNGEWCILAAKRNKKWDDEGGKMNPPMGHRHKYESPEDGAVRECEEESGIRFSKKDLVLASKEDWGTNFKLYLPGKTSDYKPGEGDEENTKFRWIPVSQIDNYEWAWSCGTFAKRFKPKK